MDKDELVNIKQEIYDMIDEYGDKEYNDGKEVSYYLDLIQNKLGK